MAGTTIEWGRYDNSDPNACRSPLAGKTLHPWQANIINIVRQDPDPEGRDILWVFERRGGVGKSSLVKVSLHLRYYRSLVQHLVIEHGAIITGGRSADVRHSIFTALEKKLRVRLIVYDVPRKSLGYLQYPAMEEIKNGCFFSSKYEGGMCVYPNPHVVVFANEPPEFGAMSADRWKVFEIVNGNLQRFNDDGAAPILDRAVYHGVDTDVAPVPPATGPIPVGNGIPSTSTSGVDDTDLGDVSESMLAQWLADLDNLE